LRRSFFLSWARHQHCDKLLRQLPSLAHGTHPNFVSTRLCLYIVNRARGSSQGWRAEERPAAWIAQRAVKIERVSEMNAWTSYNVSGRTIGGLGA
jgi:hypothetical protein